MDTDTNTNTNANESNSIENKTDKNDDDYIITTNVNKKISDELKLNSFNFNDKFSWKSPNEYGLSNSNAIIPNYYNIHKNPQKIFTIDYLEIIKDDIKNFRTLNKYQLEYIKSLPHEHKNELFDIFNECIDSVGTILK